MNLAKWHFKYLIKIPMWVFVNAYKECTFWYHFWLLCIDDASKYAAAGTSLRKVFHKKFIPPSAASLLPYYTTNNHAIRSYLLRIYNSLFLNVTYVFPDEKMISILCKWSRFTTRTPKFKNDLLEKTWTIPSNFFFAFLRSRASMLT